jgi:hypothetical protein
MNTRYEIRHAHTSDRVGVRGSVESNSTISVCAGIARTGKETKRTEHIRRVGRGDASLRCTYIVDREDKGH